MLEIKKDLLEITGICGHCHYCFSNPDGEGFVCADMHYGKIISDELSQIKDCYTESLILFIDRVK